MRQASRWLPLVNCRLRWLSMNRGKETTWHDKEMQRRPQHGRRREQAYSAWAAHIGDVQQHNRDGNSRRTALFRELAP